MYEGPTSRFVIYADKQLLTATALAHIKDNFRLPKTNTFARTDPHYRNAQTIGPLRTVGA